MKFTPSAIRAISTESIEKFLGRKQSVDAVPQAHRDRRREERRHGAIAGGAIRSVKKLALYLCLTSFAFAADDPSLPPKAALDAINADDLLKHIKVLASDEFEGRAPGSKGEELTINYLTEQFKKIGLKPGNPNGTYIQDVPFAGISTQPPLRSASKAPRSN